MNGGPPSNSNPGLVESKGLIANKVSVTPFELPITAVPKKAVPNDGLMRLFPDADRREFFA